MTNKPKIRPCRFVMSDDSRNRLFLMNQKSHIKSSTIVELSVDFTFTMAGLLGAASGLDLGDSVRAMAEAYRKIIPDNTSEFGRDPVRVRDSIELLNALLLNVNPGLLSEIENELLNNKTISIK